jgi:hypothetical protein
LTLIPPTWTSLHPHPETGGQPGNGRFAASEARPGRWFPFVYGKADVIAGAFVAASRKTQVFKLRDFNFSV